MAYLKINSLYIIRYIILFLFLIGSYYVTDTLKDLYKTELSKNLKFEKKVIGHNEYEILKLESRNWEKEKNFDDYLDYFFYTILIGISIVYLVNRKIESENKRLDELEKN